MQQQAALPTLQAQADEARDLLALMVGREPGALDARLAADQPLPQLPARVPVDDARALIQRRPDVRKAERELAASSAQIGQALSAYFPQVTLLGSIGAGATSISDLGRDSAATVIAPFLRWSLFDFGVNKARVAQAGRATRRAWPPTRARYWQRCRMPIPRWRGLAPRGSSCRPAAVPRPLQSARWP